MRSWGAWLALLFAVSGSRGMAAPVRPNFVVVLGEGAGWASSSVQMDDRNPASKGTGIRTPQLERLAAAGMRFSDAYAASPRCTPSRAALFTGRSPAALHMTFVGEGRGRAGAGETALETPRALLELPEQETTIAEFLGRAGYATAHFGKWHVGRVHPRRHGFDESDGPTGNGGPDNVANPNPEQARAMTARGVDFMERQAAAGRPFYLQLSHYPGQEERGGGRRRAERDADEAAAADESLGRVLDAVARLGLADHTYVLYTTDHGSPGRNGPLRGGKGSVWEGGLRVPFVLSGPGIARGVCSHACVNAMDVFPTFAGLGAPGVPLPEGLEGGSLVPVLEGGGNGGITRRRGEFVVHFPHYDKDPSGPASSIRLGTDKLVLLHETGERQLFDLARDPGEREDRASSDPGLVRRLGDRLDAHLREVGAQMPVPRRPSKASEPAPPPASLPQVPVPERTPRPEPRGNGEFRMPTPAFRTEVPSRPFDLVLGRPTRDSVAVTVLAHGDLEGYVAYGEGEGKPLVQTEVRRLTKGVPATVVLAGLRPDTRYRYRFHSRVPGAAVFEAGDEHRFGTARPPGSTFVFTVQADSHLDYNMDPEVYRRSLGCVVAAGPDFHVDLGDTFMTEKYNDHRLALPHYLAQRHYLGLACADAPLFLVLGNHDGEAPVGGRRGATDEMAVWANATRKALFPNPVPDAFYSGNATPHPRAGLLEDYYAWEWGDAQFVVLDPYWFSARQRGRDGDNWGRSLGADQYQWLRSVLDGSRARHRFVFLHNLVGGATPEGRGGAEASRFYEWGGQGPDGKDGFARMRPGWPDPVHDLLARHPNTVVFHGHDHFYARQVRDGVVYLLVPQPGHPRFDNPRDAAAYGYHEGVLQGPSGIVRVTVSPEKAVLEYVRAYPPAAEGPGRRTGDVTDRHSLP